jgi:hypothetical protein
MPPAPAASDPRRLPARLAWIGGLAALVWFCVWTPAHFSSPWLFPTPHGYYPELTEGFLSGHLYLPRTPDPRLAALPDPYDPAANADFRINDLSYFHGRYYLYHGVAPVLTLFLPFRLLTGHHLSEAAAAALFTLGGMLLTMRLLVLVRRALFPRCPATLFLACVVAAVLGQGYQAVLRGGTVNLVPIAAAYCFLSLTLWALWHAVASATAGRRWLALASLACGLAIASRPNYLFCAPLLLLPAVADGWRAGQRLDRGAWQALLPAFAPLAAVLLGLLAYNHARFGQPLEFGARYMLGNWDQRQLAPVGPGDFLVNFHRYFLSAADYHATFPYVTAPSWQAVGLLWHAPFLWLLVLLPVAWRRVEQPPFRLLLTAAAAAGVANLLVLLFLPSGNPAAEPSSANARYVLDFQPALVLGTSLVVLALGEAWRGQPRLIRGLTLFALPLALASALVAVCLDFHRYPPESYRPLAQVLNRPVWWWQNLRGHAYGPVELQIQLPAGRTGAYEPLLASGSARSGEMLTLFYEAPGLIRLGLINTRAVGPQSEPITLDANVPHRLEIHLGSLYPPDGHPAWTGFSDDQVALLRRRVSVRLDGHTVFEAPAFSPPNESNRVLIGHTDFLRAYAQERFTGNILASRRGPLSPADAPSAPAPAYGSVRLRLLFPPDRAGITEPLVATGIPGAGDLLHVTYREDGAIRLGLDHWGRPGAASDWIVVPPSAEHILEFSSGALYPAANHSLLASLPPDERQRLKERVRIHLDGRIVLDAALTAYDSSPHDVAIGCNPLGASSAVYAFSGRILSRERLPPPAAPR